ncbi:hypothetical protein AYR61_09885 [Secundilactobacillus paracollinoides]|uniref:Uncharacterized protein n=1 Tax=Secundilactobacillus paracollinoides TaxID=240427 RepID=A0A1B2IZS8_9LACO|nr:hypothetical protein AYR61_09885 [Secundilactobacillus paracollinoides]ANZ67555.1 hypothetical protein AYR63_10630 [Secundilactobacillus paracollinoides]
MPGFGTFVRVGLGRSPLSSGARFSHEAKKAARVRKMATKEWSLSNFWQKIPVLDFVPEVA